MNCFSIGNFFENIEQCLIFCYSISIDFFQSTEWIFRWLYFFESNYLLTITFLINNGTRLNYQFITKLIY